MSRSSKVMLSHVRAADFERILPVNSPKIEKIEVVRKGKVRRAKLYYLRGRQGKAARIQEKL